jgi:hypothetical protein
MEEAFAGLTLKVRKPKVAADAVVAKKPRVARKLDVEDKTQYQRITFTAEQIDVKPLQNCMQSSCRVKPVLICAFFYTVGYFNFFIRKKPRWGFFIVYVFFFFL